MQYGAAMFFGLLQLQSHPVATALATTSLTTPPAYFPSVRRTIWISRRKEAYLTTGLCEALFVDEMQ